MSGSMKILSFERMVEWIFEEYSRHRSIFGIPEEKFYLHKNNRGGFRLHGDFLETPFGPAAGPHTQLSQNIICAYLTGCRFIELKTVQVLDALEFEKPCIDAFDEGYNTEWSQELTLEDSLDEYIKSWVLIHVLRDSFELSPSKDETGFMFNMSIGYDLKGIQSEKMERFIYGMLNPKSRIDRYLDIFQTIYPERSPVSVPERIIDSVTISTMHGCPPEEIEDIVRYLIREKGLNTYVKLNPTLLGKEEITRILNRTGFDYVSLEDETFEKDLQYKNAVTLIKTLKKYAKNYQRDFGVKLSNTLANKNITDKLPGKERYMSGRALFPITIMLAYKLASEFDGKINISYAGGASAHNVKDIVKTGIYPVTIATDVLKPGGYLRFYQMARQLEEASEELFSLAEGQVQVERLKDLAERSLTDAYYQKERMKTYSIKFDSALPHLDCINAPCILECPIHQDIAEYIDYISKKDYTRALEVILKKNPLPNITGYICNHTCVQKCARWNYDNPLEIRALKRIAAQRGDCQEAIKNIKLEMKSKKRDGRIAIIGSGPAGLASGYFLAREGFEVTIFETREKSGGTVRYIIPRFRIPDSAVDKDVSLIQELGVNIVTAYGSTYSVEKLKEEGYDYTIIATGCGKAKELDFDGNKVNQGYYTAIDLLERIKRGEKLFVGDKVLVIGGGNSAIDAARAALRFSPDFVHIIYRRDLDNMPADREEIDACLEEGAEIKEFLQPEALITQDARIVGLECIKTELGEPDESGRKRPIPVRGSQVRLEADTVIVAVGEEVETSLLRQNSVKLGRGNRISIDEATGETNIPRVYAVGDCVSGPATVVKAIADAKKITLSIMERERIQKEGPLTDSPYSEVSDEKRERSLSKHGEVRFSNPIDKPSLDKQGRDSTFTKTFSEKVTQEESNRCFGCNQVCNKCVETCPNRANIALRFQPMCLNVPVLSAAVGKPGEIPENNYILRKMRVNQTTQIMHVDDFCNECGNCETFCPYNGRPYIDKFTLFSGRQPFERSNNSGFYLQSSLNDKIHRYRCRLHDLVFDMVIDSQKGELSFLSDQFTVCFDTLNKGDTLTLKTHSYSGSEVMDMSEMIGLYYIVNKVTNLYPYLLEMNEER